MTSSDHSLSPGTHSQRIAVNWRLPVFFAAAASLVLLTMFTITADASLLYDIIVEPLVCLTLIVVLVAAVIRRQLSRSLSIAAALIAFIVTSWALEQNQGALRPWIRWHLWSPDYKSAVLSQPQAANGQFKHVEWDGWGGGPIGDWTAYVVFDPTDSLAQAAKSASSERLQGIPCPVDQVRRLETHWCSVTLSMNEWWEQCR